MAILTISREFGSGGREIGRAVAALMNYDYVDKERLLADLRAAGSKWEHWGMGLDEHRPTLWERHDWSFRGVSALLQSSILDHACRDNVVIMGRGGNFLLGGIAAVLRVRIFAPAEQRIERIITRESVDRETASWIIKRTDSDREGFIRSLFGKRWDDPAEYDIVFDTSRQQENDIVSSIVDELQKRGPALGDRILDLRAETAKVRAALLTNPAFFLPALDVHHDHEGIILRGVVHSPKEHKAVEEEAKRVAKKFPVRCELRYRV